MNSIVQEGMEEGIERVYDIFQRAGLHVKRDWLRQAATTIPLSQLEFVAYELALYSDLRLIGCGCLPNDISNCEKANIQDRYILQVDEVINIGEAADSRQEDTRNRMLKLMLTDGRQSLTGIELTNVRDLSVNSHAGVKVMVQNFEVRRGMALFTSDNLKVLGGMVPELEKSRLDKIERVESIKKRRQLIPDATGEAQTQDNNVMISNHPPQVGAGRQASIDYESGHHDAVQNGAPEMQRSAYQRLQAPNRDIVDADLAVERLAFSSNRFDNHSHNPDPHQSPENIGQIFLANTMGSSTQQASFTTIDTNQCMQVSGNSVPGNLVDVESLASGLQTSIQQSSARLAADLVIIEIDDSDAVDRHSSSLPTRCQQVRNVSSETDDSAFRYLRDFDGVRPESSAVLRVKAAVMGVVSFKWDQGAFSLVVTIQDGTGTANVELGDHLVQPIIGISNQDYARLDRKSRKPLNAKMSARLSHLEAIFTLERSPGTANLTARAVDENCSAAAYPLLRRVLRGSSAAATRHD